MSTTDVPGSKKEHNDHLHAGCWAEHEDGSLILVHTTEGKTVLYDVFDLKPKEVSRGVVNYIDAMEQKRFEDTYSFKPAKSKRDGVSEKWTWHDKTPFPWQKVIDAGMELMKLKEVGPIAADVKAAENLGKTIGTDGVEPYETSQELLTAAQRVAATLKLKSKGFSIADVQGKVPQKRGRTSKATIVDRLGGALRCLRGDMSPVSTETKE